MVYLMDSQRALQIDQSLDSALVFLIVLLMVPLMVYLKGAQSALQMD